MDTDTLRRCIERRASESLALLRTLVESESPSGDKPALDHLVRLVADTLRETGLHVALLPNPAGGDHLLATRAGAQPQAAHVLILGHLDTVWPLGTLEKMPFHAADGIAHGPGIFDMKAGVVCVIQALRVLAELGEPCRRPLRLLLTSDEEIGSPTSRCFIEQHAQGAALTLVAEPPLPGGVLKTSRKGVGSFQVEAHGRAAHAGIEPDRGANAVVELARQILRIQELGDRARETTVHVTVVSGGDASNVIPAHAVARVDARAWTRDESCRVEAAMIGLQAVDPEVTLTVRGGFNRPPMERTEATARLFQAARQAAACLGLDLAEGATGGGSDGNFTAALGVPTLDGLGCDGQGAHAPHEHILLSSLPTRIALWTALLREL